MALIKQNHIANGIPRFFDDFLNRDLFDWSQHNFSAASQTLPAVNILETNEDFKVEMAAPGLNKQDFSITLDNNLLTISVDKQDTKVESEMTNFIRREFLYQNFQRSIHLSKDVVDLDQIQAKYEDGLLFLTIPKREEAKKLPPRMIEIS